MSDDDTPKVSRLKDGIERPLIIYLIAGEASGDFIGAHLMRSLRAQSKQNIYFYGIGGKKMTKEGLNSLFPYHELSLMGFIEVLPYILRTLARINLTVNDIVLKQPDMVITIDSPGFCFRVVEKLRKLELKSKFVHYVAPTVWAYKPQRAQKCAKLFDHILVLLPFEPPYFKAVGLDCTLVGHPIVYENMVGDGNKFREKYEIPDSTPIFCLLPGSRKSEINRHMPVFTRAIAILSTCYPQLALVISVPEHAMPLLFPYLNTCPFRVVVTENDEDKRNSIAASCFAFVKSGTVTFEVAMAGVPMLVTYRMNMLSVWWLRRIITTKYANLMNTLLKKEAIPELLQEHSTPLMLASCANTLLKYPKLQQQQKENINKALEQLKPKGGILPSDIAANKILSLLS